MLVPRARNLRRGQGSNLQGCYTRRFSKPLDNQLSTSPYLFYYCWQEGIRTHIFNQLPYSNLSDWVDTCQFTPLHQLNGLAAIWEWGFPVISGLRGNSWNRTNDTLVFGQVLYLLSYVTIFG